MVVNSKVTVFSKILVKIVITNNTNPLLVTREKLIWFVRLTEQVHVKNLIDPKILVDTGKDSTDDDSDLDKVLVLSKIASLIY